MVTGRAHFSDPASSPYIFTAPAQSSQLVFQGNRLFKPDEPSPLVSNANGRISPDKSYAVVKLLTPGGYFAG